MAPAARNPWLTCPRPLQSPALRLFCFPHSGASPVVFQKWPNYLPAGVEMQAVHYPGRGVRLREPPYQRIEPFVEALAAALTPLLEDAPFAFFGHSLGALLAFELTHLLREAGLRPQAFIASACHAPQLMPPDEKLHLLSRDGLIAALKRMEGTPPDLFAEAELLDLMLPTLRADMAVYETYVYEPREALACPLVACGGREDNRVATWEVEAWRRQAAGPYEDHLFAGGHFYVNEALAQLGQIFARVLTPG